MTVHRLKRLLEQCLLNHVDIASVYSHLYSAGAALHVIANDGRKLRILIDEED